MTDFAALLLRSLPGIYRQKDASSQLARFLEIMASPLAETETSIGQLYEDLFAATARAEFLPLVGALIGADIDPAQPASLQRAALEDALPFFRSKGLAQPLARTVEAFTGWRTVAVDYSQVVARTPHVETLAPGRAPLAPQTFDLRDSQRMAQLGRSDDPAPYTIDLRSPAQPSDRIGRAHFDNHGLFLTVSKSFANRIPTELVRGARSGFSFDDAPLPEGNTAGRLIQLLDGIDGSPITIGKLSGHEADFVDTPRGFTISARGVSLFDPAFGAGARVIAAQLADLANPTDVTNAPLTLGPRDIAVDPQRGRFLLTLGSFGITAAELRVGYLLAPVVRTTGATPAPIGGTGSNTYAFAPDGRIAPLRDGIDGTPLSVKLELGGSLFRDYQDTPRGYRLLVDGFDITRGTVTSQATSLDEPRTALGGQLLVDVDRGRFAVPAGTIPPGAAVTVDFSSADSDAEAQMFERLAQRLPRLVPAGITPVVVDTRKPFVDPRNL